MTFLDYSVQRPDRTSNSDCESCFNAPFTHTITAGFGLDTTLRVCLYCAERFERNGWASEEIRQPDPEKPYQEEWEEVYGKLPELSTEPNPFSVESEST